MKFDVLSSCTVITKEGRQFDYVIENGISLEELNTYFINEYKENLSKVVLNRNFGYLHK